MDKKTACKILNLELNVSFQEAKQAYRALAKKNHPDLAAKKTGLKTRSDEKMKEINLAFRYLAPRLRVIKTIKRTPEEEKIKTSEKRIKKHFISGIINRLFRALKAKKATKGVGKKNKKQQPLRKRNGKPVQFDDIFKRTCQSDSLGKKQTFRYKKKKYSRKSSDYNEYQRYMILKQRLKSRPSSLNQDTRIGRVEKISPVKPVGRV